MSRYFNFEPSFKLRWCCARELFGSGQSFYFLCYVAYTDTPFNVKNWKGIPQKKKKKKKKGVIKKQVLCFKIYDFLWKHYICIKFFVSRQLFTGYVLLSWGMVESLCLFVLMELGRVYLLDIYDIFISSR